MGHRKLAGLCSEQEIAGQKVLRLDVPCDPPATQFYGAGAIYALTPTTEDLARRYAARSAPEPVARWELPAPPRPSIDAAAVPVPLAGLAVIVGDDFARRIREAMSPAEFEEMRRRNASLGPNTCASHDFLDANALMDEALTAVGFEQALGDDFEGSPYQRVWNAAWDHARRLRLTADDPDEHAAAAEEAEAARLQREDEEAAGRQAALDGTPAPAVP
jgi:hypothetical protein